MGGCKRGVNGCGRKCLKENVGAGYNFVGLVHDCDCILANFGDAFYFAKLN